MFNKEAFKKCPVCNVSWKDRETFLSDPKIKLRGYQVSFNALEEGLFLFDHSCQDTLVLPVQAFRDLYTGPVFQARKTGTAECPGYCLRKEEFRRCPSQCECAYVREIIQIVNSWAKK
jgi:hypothetical protein